MISKTIFTLLRFALAKLLTFHGIISFAQTQVSQALLQVQVCAFELTLTSLQYNLKRLF